MQITIVCNEYVAGDLPRGFTAVEIGNYSVEVKCRKECLDLANKAVRAALAILQGEKA